MRINVGGKFSFKSLSKEKQEEIKKELAEKSDVLKQGKEGIIPGIKIDGKVVTKDNIKDFEISKKEAKAKKKEGYTKSELEKYSFLELKEIGKKFGTTDRSKTNLIKEILKLQ